MIKREMSLAIAEAVVYESVELLQIKGESDLPFTASNYTNIWVKLFYFTKSVDSLDALKISISPELSHI